MCEPAVALEEPATIEEVQHRNLSRRGEGISRWIVNVQLVEGVGAPLRTAHSHRSRHTHHVPIGTAILERPRLDALNFRAVFLQLWLERVPNWVQAPRSASIAAIPFLVVRV